MDVAALLGRYHVQAMVDSAPISQLYRWFAYLQIRGPQNGDRLDIAVDRLLALQANRHRPKGTAPMPLLWWNTEQKPKPDKPREDVHDQIHDLVEVEKLRQQNIERGNALRAKKKGG